jgi:F-type H+-transporting ATPase subunit b
VLDFDPVTIVVTIINLAILFFILRKLLFKPVTKFIEERREKIQAELEKAAADRDEAKSLRESYEAKLKKAEAEAEALAAKKRSAAEKQAERIIMDAKEQAENIVASARKQIAAERQASFLAFKAEAAALIIAAAGRLLRRDMDSAVERERAELVLREIGNKL